MKKIKKPHSSDKYIWRIIKTREPVHGQLVIKNVLSKTANHARLRVFSDPYFPVLYRKIQFWENPCSGIFYAAKNWASYWHTILKAIHNTAYDMRKYVFSLTRILAYFMQRKRKPFHPSYFIWWQCNIFSETKSWKARPVCQWTFGQSHVESQQVFLVLHLS